MTAWYLLAPETIDETMATLLERKRTVIDAVTEGDVRQDGPLVNKVVRELRGAAVPAPSRRGVSHGYVHGYDPRESERLRDQAGTLVELLHARHRATRPGSTVLEAGCGVGAQTVTLAAAAARRRASPRSTSPRNRSPRPSGGRDDAGLANVEFRQADIFDLPFEAAVVRPRLRLLRARAPLAARSRRCSALQAAAAGPAARITVIEGDHGSAYFHPRQRRGARGDPVPGRAPGARPAATR